MDYAKFENELTTLINKHGAESMSNTPDYILAAHLTDCLRSWEFASLSREEWYGGRLVPGQHDSPWQPNTQEPK